MACFHPRTAYQKRVPTGGEGRVRFSTYFFVSRKIDYITLTIPCRQCVGCRLALSRYWATRCVNESTLYKHNCFLTLTYDDKTLPVGYDIRTGLYHPHFQDFMKRLRDRYNYIGLDGENGIRFYMCGEYGEKNARPHFHVLLFNFDFLDRYHWTTRNGNPSYRSPLLDGLPINGIDRRFVEDGALWPWGNAEIGECNFQSAAYVARYIMKKQTGKRAIEHYEVFDNETGEVFSQRPEYNEMSTNPGIGKRWIEKFTTDVYPRDELVINGVKTRPPRYYDEYFKTKDLSEYEDLKFRRFDNSKKHIDNNTPERLAVREQIAEARLSRLKRTLD